MKVLLVHQNFPGQFRHVAPALVQRGHEVAVITAGENKVGIPHLNARYAYDPPAKKAIVDAGAPLAAHHAQMVGRGAAAARVAARLRDERGFVPDVVFGHPGWGEMLYLSAVWPDVPQLHYAEFYYAPNGRDADFDPEFQTPSLSRAVSTMAMRSHIGQSMLEATAAVAPTAWQASSFPRWLQPAIRVIHDGVDVETFRPDPAAAFRVPGADLELRAGDEVLTYVARNIEPYRGAHVFLRALPEVLAARPKARVVIVGATGQSYGPAPPGGGSWKDRLLAEVGGRLDPARVHFTGWLGAADYRRLLQVSRVHAYLTYPFVLSWSLIEAMASGAAIVASRTAPVEEVITDGVNGRLVDFFDVPGWSSALAEALADPEALEPLRRAARRTAVERYALSHCLPRMLDLVEQTARGRRG